MCFYLIIKLLRALEKPLPLEVYASPTFDPHVLAMRASLGGIVKHTPLTHRQEHEFKVETILRLPVTRSTVETESLEIAAVDGRGLETEA